MAEQKKRKASPFKKAKAEQAYIKMGLYGPSGSGKTFTSLLIAEGLARLMAKRVAYIDTERGTDFYCQEGPSRKVHPEAFDFDAIYSKSITDILGAVESVDPDEHGVLVIDSITHVWEAARNAYNGKMTKAGTIPFHAWGKIKKPYKDIMTHLLSSRMHVIICGREGNEFEEDDETGELKVVGKKMKAEGETPYEPHILIRMEAVKDPRSKSAIITAFAEKDRTGVLAGETIHFPNYENMVVPLLPMLGDKQAVIQSEEETTAKDSEVLTDQEKAKIKESETILGKYQARFSLCESLDDLKEIGAEITPELKKKMTSSDVSELRSAYLETEERFGSDKKPF